VSVASSSPGTPKHSRGWVARVLRGVERVAWAAGILCLAGWGAVYLTGVMGARRAVTGFVEARQAGLTEGAGPDLSLWSPNRIQAWKDSLRKGSPAALALLRIPRIGLEVPVLEGTDDWTLNRAVGHIEDTAGPGGNGNVGIAGHRDGFFRGLKDVAVGDALELETQRGIERYLIERIWVVAPEDISVLDPTPSPTLTLVTCYPFYFIGSAPQRYIVRAARTPP
jgi:sortase A